MLLLSLDSAGEAVLIGSYDNVPHPKACHPIVHLLWLLGNEIIYRACPDCRTMVLGCHIFEAAILPSAGWEGEGERRLTRVSSSHSIPRGASGNYLEVKTIHHTNTSTSGGWARHRPAS
jgi:hypothetical protein